MNSEDLVEEGIVVKAGNGMVDVQLISKEECKHCSAKIICKPKDESTNILHLKDDIDVEPGDKVKISVKGSALFKASILLYGIPLLLLFVGIIIGMSFFSQSTSVELYSFVFAVVLIAIYFSLIFFIPGMKNKIQEKPRITLAD